MTNIYKAKLQNGEMGFINPPHANQDGQTMMKYGIRCNNRVWLPNNKHLRKMVYKVCIIFIDI